MKTDKASNRWGKLVVHARVCHHTQNNKQHVPNVCHLSAIFRTSAIEKTLSLKWKILVAILGGDIKYI